MAGGRPPKFKTPEELEKIIDEYFESCKPKQISDKDGKILIDKNGNPVYEYEPVTLTGLAIALGFASRQSIYDYENRNDKFSYTIKKARLYCEHFVEKETMRGTIPPAVGIFILKNYNWRDTLNVDHGGEIKQSIKKMDLTEEEAKEIVDKLGIIEKPKPGKPRTKYSG